MVVAQTIPACFEIFPVHTVAPLDSANCLCWSSSLRRLPSFQGPTSLRPKEAIPRVPANGKWKRTAVPGPLNMSSPQDVSTAMLSCAEEGLLSQAQVMWDELVTSSALPPPHMVSQLINTYGKMGYFIGVNQILDQLASRSFDSLPEVYSAAITCFGRHGRIDLMENAMNRMVTRGIPVGSATANAFVRYYSVFGSLLQMESAYGRLRRSGYILKEDAIRAMSLAYIRGGEFFRLGEFLRGVGLGRRDVGNLLWNLLLLSYAANFKMKTLQREFLRMLDAGFSPDITTFNIRALAFSRMLLFWDLHLNLEHMKHECVVADLVTYGSVVDAYLDRRLGRNLSFALNKLSIDDSPTVSTDIIVFEALGKGDFHLSSEAFMEFRGRTKWTYSRLITLYLKKQFRRDQIFWNY